ncbi:MarR family winged helix-turn-helix transcriptional regulator [Leuconostoc inhae]|uniref:MarR family winged helix-turn-helix transcriptional regulator n=1 Tax=Leuconostoc inhae TaxID=178001 RepID=UPI001C7D802C|nr:MarR family transcriptional regulator [Leuconostoc inhae]
MDNQSLFNELGELVQQPLIWLAAQHSIGGGNGRSDSSRRLLRILSETDKELTAGAIADILDIRPASVTALINKLESDNLVIRAKDGRDARIVKVKITATGRQQLQDVDDSRQDFQESLFSVLNDAERLQLAESLHKLNAHVVSDEFTEQLTKDMDKHRKMMFEHLIKARGHQNEHMRRGFSQLTRQIDRETVDKHDRQWPWWP